MPKTNPPLSPSEYQEYQQLNRLSDAQQGNKHVRYLELRYRFMLYLGKKVNH